VSGGRAYGGIHGVWHAPRGSDPSACDAWRELVTAGTAWSSGTNYSPGDTVDDGNLRWEAILASGPGHGGAVEPGVNSQYVAYWWCQASVFITGSNMSPTVDVPSPVPSRYRLSVGAPNYLEIDGSISFYTEHQIEVQLDVTGVTTGDIVFLMPPEYQHSYDVPYHTHDDTGAYVACRLLATGEFIYGVP
jgi:hypothetical protein